MDLMLCRSALQAFAGKRVLVLGDLMLDEHIWGNVARVSPEAPVIVVDVDSPDSDCRPGGAANVANNIRALGGEVSIIGVVGEDEGGRILVSSLENVGVDVSGIVVDKTRPTTRKTRIWASHRHQVVRVDRESKKKISSGVVKQITEHLRKLAETVDAILISDYNKGVVIKDVVSAAVNIANERGKISISNAKPKNLSICSGIGVVTLNQSEASIGAGIEIEDIQDVERAGRKILATALCRNLVITRGAHGMAVFEGIDNTYHIPAVESEVYDVAGAGDTVVSAFTLAMAGGASLETAGLIANCAGGAVVRKVGVATTTVAELAVILNV